MFACISEADASELLENIEDKFLRYHMDTEIISRS